jgi:hypothetical protein
VWAFLAIWRLYFHPLRKIPGPRLAAMTSWYEFYYDVICDGQYPKRITQLHKEFSKVLWLYSSI